MIATHMKTELGHVAEVTSGQPAPQDPNAFGDTGRPFIRAGSLERLVNGGCEESLEHIPDNMAEQFRMRPFPPNTIVFAKSGMSAKIGRVYRLKTPCYVVSHLAAVIPGDDLVPGYLQRWLEKHPPSRLIPNDAYPSIRVSAIAALKIPLPSLDEQKRIAAILDQADAIRRKRRAAIDELNTLVPALFYDMFGDPVTNPRGWKTGQIGQLSRIVTGSTPPSKLDGMFGGDLPFMTPGDLENGEPALRFLTPEGASKSRTVRKGATLVCCIGATIGKTDIAPRRCAFNQQINAIEWAETIDDLFGFWFMSLTRHNIINRAIKTTLPILKKSAFSTLPIVVPPIDLQRDFANKVESIRAMQDKYRQAANETDDLFNSLVQRAFKGQL